MSEPVAPRISKWPFFLGDGLLLALAWLIHSQSNTPTGRWELLAYVLCVGAGAGISILPFLKEYQAALKLAESDRLVSTISQIQSLDQLAAQIGYATSQWQVIRDSADKTATSAKDIAQGMAAEVKSFNEFLQKSNEGEKSTLRLEVEKLRRAEVEWLQVVVRMLDHVFALHQAAVRSRQPGVADQMEKFKLACHDAVRRIGLVPFVATPAEAFDEQRHQVAGAENAKAPEGATIEDTLASGFTFQGRLIRPAIVRLQNGAISPAPAAELVGVASDSKPEVRQNELL